MIDAKTVEIAEGLSTALLLGDNAAIAGGISALSLRLGGLSLVEENVSMAPHAYVLYLLCMLIQGMPTGERAHVVNLHGVPNKANHDQQALRRTQSAAWPR